MSLREALADPERREKVVEDCCTLVDSEVAKKKGLSGVVIKAAYKAVRGIKPGFIRGVVRALLDEWIAAVEPIWQRALASGRPPTAELVRGTYQKLRPSAKEHVEQAVPGLAALLAKHAA
jgi:hypothetical protein